MLKIATRRSPLALWQAEHVRARLREADPAVEIDLLPIVTEGDRLSAGPLVEVGGKGLFVKELEQALLEGRADLAVHSMKDVPAEIPDGLCLDIYLAAGDPRDALVSADGRSLRDLPAGARVGTSSLRRRAQLRSLRPDLNIHELRGNVGTRLRHVDEGRLDAALLARAGLMRLGLGDRVSETLEPDRFVPAIGQGVIGVEYRQSDAALRRRLQALHDPDTALRIDAERAFGSELGSSCRIPVAAHALLRGDILSLTGVIAHPEGHPLLREVAEGPSRSAREIGRNLAHRLLGQGGDRILADLRGS